MDKPANIVRPPAPPQDFVTPHLELRRFRYEKIEEVRIDDEVWPEWVLYWLPAGGGVLEVAGARYDLDEGRVFLVSPYTRYHLTINGRPGAGPGPHYRVKMAPVERSESERELKRAGLLPHFFAHFVLREPGDAPRAGIHAVKVDASLYGRLREACGVLRENGGQGSFAAGESCRLAALVLDVLGRVPARDWGPSADAVRIGRICEWIEEHLGERLDSTRLAEICGLPLRTFNRKFREATRTEPQDAVRAARVRAARRLLMQNEASIDRVAEACGFRDRYYFSRVFKQVTGLAPAEFRKARRAAPKNGAR